MDEMKRPLMSFNSEIVVRVCQTVTGKPGMKCSIYFVETITISENDGGIAFCLKDMADLKSAIGHGGWQDTIKHAAKHGF